MKPFSKRTEGWGGKPNPLSLKIANLKTEGRKILDLSITNPARCGFHYLTADLLDALTHPGNLDYDPDPHGLLPARRAVSDYYERKKCAVPADRIFLTAGTSEAYSFLFRLLADVGDAVLAPEPSYPILEYLTALNDIRLDRYPLRYEDGGWRIDLKVLEEKMDAVKPKALLVVHPNNPTGNLIQKNERTAISALAVRYGTAIISDEVFLDFTFGKILTAPESFAGEKDALTFTLSGISKIIGLPQMKLSWLVLSGPPTLCEEANARLEIISDTYLSTGTPVQNALPVWLKRQPVIRDEIAARLTENYACLKQLLSQGQKMEPRGFTAVVPFSSPSESAGATHEPAFAKGFGGSVQRTCGTRPRLDSRGLLRRQIKGPSAEAGWVATLECPSFRSDEEWALTFLEQDGILVHPGYLYDLQEGSFAVVSLLTPPDLFKKGLSAILQRIR